MIRIGAALLLMLSALPARAQTFVSYSCADGTMISAAFFKGDRNMRMQLDGKALSLPQRLAASGARYAKSGVVLDQGAGSNAEAAEAEGDAVQGAMMPLTA